MRSRMPALITVVAFALFAVPAVAQATTYYFSNTTGSDGNPCTQSSPCQSLGKMHALALNPGDAVALLRGDTWTGGLTINQSGSSSHRISFYGYGSASRRPLITGGQNGDCFKVTGSYVQIDNLEGDSCGYAGVEVFGAGDTVTRASFKGNAAGIHVAAGSSGTTVTGNTLQNNNILNQNTSSGSSGAFGVLLNAPALVAHNSISGSRATSLAFGWDGSGVELYNASNSTVRDNTMTDNEAGVELGGTGDAIVVAYNKITANVAGTDPQPDGIIVPGSVTDVTLAHNSIDVLGSGSQGIVCYSSCAASTTIADDAVKADRKALYMDGSGWSLTGNVFNGPMQGATPDSTNSTAPIDWVNPPSNLQEQADSPTVDHGTLIDDTSDLAGNPVPDVAGTPPDTGAYELASTSTPPPPDTTPPSAPGNLVVSGQTQTAITLSWSASSDNVGVTGYNVLRNGTKVATTTSTSFTFTGLTCGTTYSLGVNAFDAAGNTSSTSSSTATTQACPGDTTPPSAPGNLVVSGQTQTAITLSWSASSDNVGVTGYNVLRNGTKVATTTSTSFTFTGLTCGTTYTLGVDAFDAAGNVSGNSTATGTTSACPTGGGNVQHIVWVVMENHSYEQIIGNTTSAPYINSLANQYGSTTQMFAESHPSLPNYIAMTSGQFAGLAGTDSSPSSEPAQNEENIFHQLPGGGSRSLEESMPSNCNQSDSGNYAVRHDPEAYYTDIGAGHSSPTGDCANFDVPLGSTPDLSAKFTFITPNVCHDMHSNSCSGSSNVILQGDQFLQGFVPQLLNSPEYQAGNTVIFITWDEDSGSNGNHIPTIIIDPNNPHTLGGCADTSYTHYSMLRYVEETFGLPFIAGAQTATDMKGCFGLP